MKGMRFVTCLLVIGILCVMPFAAHAAYTNISLTGFQNIDYNYELTGEIYLRFPQAAPQTFSFCIDTGHNMNVPGQYWAEPQSIAGDTSRLQAAYLLDTYAPSKHGVFSGTHAWNGGSSVWTLQETGTAVQLAVWDVLGQPHKTKTQVEAHYGTKYDFLFDKAEELKGSALNVKGDLSNLSSSYEVLVLWNNSAHQTKLQDVMTTHVPLPPSAVLLGAGLVGLVGVGRRMR